MTSQVWEYINYMEEYDENGYLIDKGSEITVEPPTK